MEYRAFIGRKLLSHRIELLDTEGGKSACLIGPWDTASASYLQISSSRHYLCTRVSRRTLRKMGSVTGLFLSNENTVGPARDLLALVLRKTSRDRM